MFHRSPLIVRTLVWLTALLLPAEALPIYGCGCGEKVPAAQARTRSCCGKAAGCCCCGKAAGRCCCCCKGKNRSPAGCQCAKGNRSSDQAPAPNNTQTETAKTLAAAQTIMAVDSAAAAAPSPAADFLISTGQTSLERLSALCRLIV